MEDGAGDGEEKCMDINYHYFAVKTLALFAGFPAEDAQLLASYSQFVDDYDLFFNLHLEDVPDYARFLAVKMLDEWVFNPVTTGFRRAIDISLYGIERNQRNILVPFHLIPGRSLEQGVQDRSEWRTNAVTLGDGSLMDRLLAEARDAYIPDNADKYDLMRIGMLLHTFADTYAHQGFSGFWGWENERKHLKVINNMNGVDITNHYHPAAFPVAHAEAYTAPDHSFVRFTTQLKLRKDGPFVDYDRNNTDEYMKISLEIVNYLRSCLRLEPVNDGDTDWGIIAGTSC